jgi:hypothetical protein
MEMYQFLFVSLFWIIFLLGTIHFNCKDKQNPMEFFPPIFALTFSTTFLVLFLLLLLNNFCDGK